MTIPVVVIRQVVKLKLLVRQLVKQVVNKIKVAKININNRINANKEVFNNVHKIHFVIIIITDLLYIFN